MRNRILEFSHSAVRLSVRHRQLVIQRPEIPDNVMPMADVAVIIAAQPQMSYSQAVLAELLNNGGVFVICNQQRMPVGMLLPLGGHGTQSAFFRQQSELSQPRQKQLWKSVVQAKIAMQAMLLVRETGTDFGLTRMISTVRSGDTSNVEATAAVRYWKALFGPEFRRDRGNEGLNGLLNYGYAVLRAMTARAICAAGLHPTLGIHHCNQYNSWCLADDLMEPYRPVIDRAVLHISRGGEADLDLGGPGRQQVLQALLGRVDIGDQSWAIFDGLQRSAQSLRSVICGGGDDVLFPEGFADAADRAADFGVQCHVVDGDV